MTKGAWGKAMLDIVRESGLIRRITRRVYNNTRFIRLHSLIEEEDLYQMVMLKLLHRDNYKIYSEKYSLPGFIYRVANGVAISFNSSSQSEKEITALDAPSDSEGSPNKILASLAYDNSGDIEKIDVEKRISSIKENLDDSIVYDLEIRHENKSKPFSLRELFSFFIDTLYSKNEMKKYVVNKITKAPIPSYVFENYWSRMSSKAYKVLENV